MPKNKRSRAFVYQYCLSFTHERAEDLKRSMIENMPPKGAIFFGFYSYICHIMFRVNRKFVCFFMATLKISEFSDTTKFWITFCCSGF